MLYKGELKPKKWFLENGWKEDDKGICEEVLGFAIYNDELKAELILKEIPFDRWLGLELEDENGTQYKKEWFKILDQLEEIEE